MGTALCGFCGTRFCKRPCALRPQLLHVGLVEAREAREAIQKAEVSKKKKEDFLDSLDQKEQSVWKALKASFLKYFKLNIEELMQETVDAVTNNGMLSTSPGEEPKLIDLKHWEKIMKCTALLNSPALENPIVKEQFFEETVLERVKHGEAIFQLSKLVLIKTCNTVAALYEMPVLSEEFFEKYKEVLERIKAEQLPNRNQKFRTLIGRMSFAEH